MSDLEKLMNRIAVNNETGCWDWIGALDTHGYPQLRFNGKTRLAHRLFYELSKEAIPAGMCLCHRCDRPVCVNPDHMFIGTRQDNMNDMVGKGRHRNARLYGATNPMSKLTEVDIVAIRSARGKVYQRELAEKYGISRPHISQIQTGGRWSHIK